MNKPFYITTPLYYVNAEPHIGHAYTTVLADVLARYHRIFGDDVHFLTGTDEHGQKVDAAAKKLGRTPIEHCDITSKAFDDVWTKLGIQYDDFIRTTEDRHKKIVHQILQQIYDAGDIYKKEYEGWYSVFEEQFFTEKDLVDGKDPIGGRPVELIKETNYFFKMSKYQDWLLEHYESNPDAIVPSFRRNEVLGFLRKPLNDLCISRPKSRLSWGIEIPWDSDYVTYVWFDALLNYYTATVSPPEGKQATWPVQYHLIGKDILTTHAIYWPTMLKAAGLKPPEHILAHGWWLTKNAAKMSKSAGNVVKPLDLADVYGSDPFRYFLMRDMVIGQDSNFSEESIVKRLNGDLANDLGNLLNRVTKLLTQHFDGIIPDVVWDEEDPLIELSKATTHKVRQLIDGIQIHAAIEETLQFVRAINRDITEAAPWTTIKTDKEQAGRDLARAAESLRIAAVMLLPVMPAMIPEVLTRLGVADPADQTWDSVEWGETLTGKTAIYGDALFPRYQKPAGTDEKQEPKPQKKKEKPAKPKTETDDGLISFNQFKEVDLRTAVVLEAEPIEDTDKLMKLKIDLGTEQRQLVAGIKQHYTPEQIVGKTIIVVANLQPAKIRGVESNGMLLAVHNGDELRLLTPDSEVTPGRRVS
jgi:methionyl-tRNA synthetase